MSLAMFAAPFNDNSNSESIMNDNNSIINKKRQTHNRTQKIYPKEGFNAGEINTNKVNNVLDEIHKNSKVDDENSGLTDFNPPPKPKSAGVNKTITTEEMMNMTNQNNSAMFRTLGRAPQPNYEGDDNLDLNDYGNYGDSKSVEEYYKKILPGYNPNREPINKPYYNQNVTTSHNQDNQTQDPLMQKLNYMITLLENQQDEKTNNTTEEIILYSFLGIFIIFIVDSFARVGKYVR
jgi:hypothetical protein